MGSQQDVPFPIVSNKSVLDCPICLLPLTIPVYQCHYGHILCSSCFDRLKKRRCPSCRCENLGKTRNRAIEQVLESVTTFCAYTSTGCTAGQLTYDAKRLHEQTCAHAPYKCPYFTFCGFMGSPVHLYKHIEKAHSESCIPLRSGFKFFYKKGIRFVFFLDDDGSVVFVLHTRTMEMYSVQDPEFNSEPLKFPFSMFVKMKSRSYVFQPTTVSCSCADDADWNVVTDDYRTDDAVVLDLIFKGCDTIVIQLVDLCEDAMSLG